jgi:serine/threonine-protein kinase
MFKEKYIGKRLDARYEIHQLIGVGGMAHVYKAYDVIERKIVAVKILKEEFMDNAEFMRRFRNESKAVAMLSHPNIVKISNVSFGSKIQYIVMEYIFGATLKRYFEGRELDMAQAVDFAIQILTALRHAHSRGIIHRDIKPQNIMILEKHIIKVMDFGIARIFNGETKTMSDETIGSVHYISPEQAKGTVIDSKSDIYSVGIILYEMLTGTVPFDAENAVTVAIMQMQNNPKSLRSINPVIPEGLEEITLKAMEKNPAKRYQSADEMLADILAFKEDGSMRFGYDVSYDENPTIIIGSGSEFNPKEIGRKKTIFIAGGATVVVLFALVFMFMTIFTNYGSMATHDVDVPNFVGMKISEIEGNKNYKFRWKIDTIFDPEKPIGIILAQSPEAGSKKIKSNAFVTLKVNSSGILTEVPPVAGLRIDTARARLSASGLKCEISEVFDNKIPSGIVVSSEPAPYTKMPVETTVMLFVSKGPEDLMAPVPDVIGKTLSEAAQIITDAGFKFPNDIQYEKSDKAKDIVIATDPMPGENSRANLGSEIKVTVSSGFPKEKTVKITIDLPELSTDIELKVYIDGEFDRKFDVDPRVISQKTLQFSGTGTKRIDIKIGNSYYKRYEVNFTEDTVRVV